MALQSVLRRLAGSAPVLVVIDDVQWLDRASAAAAGLRVPSVARLPGTVTGRADGSSPAAAMMSWGSGEPCQGQWSG